MTVLEIVKAAAYQTGMSFVPSALAAATDNASLQLLHLFYETGRELRQARTWPQLKKQHTIYLSSGRSEYPLPKDFYAALPSTHWDQGNRWEMLGPVTDSQWDYRLYGYITLENRKAFRVFGPDINSNSGGGQIKIHPTPGDGDTDTPLTFEYISKSWLFPPSWAASTSYSSGNYVNCAGNVYLYSSGSTSGSVPPNMAYGVGRDGAVLWLALSTTSWANDTYYAAGSYVTNGGRLYYCTVGGKSASSGGPTGTDEETAVTDNTASWIYRAVDSWAGEYEFTRGDHILISAQYYRCVTPGTQASTTQKTGLVQPTWTPTTVSDGGVVWTYQTATYDTVRTDNDLCLFDDELMIAGLKWRFLRARGLEYQDLLGEYEAYKNSAAGRYSEGQKLSLGGDYYTLAGLNPSVREGSFG